MAELLRDQGMTAGQHQLELQKPGLPGGLYFLRLTAGRETLCRKILLLK